MKYETSRPLEEYKRHKENCVKLKSKIEPLYNEILAYTDPMNSVTTSKLEGTLEGTYVNSSISDAQTSFKNFISYALFGIKKKWAKSDVIKPLLAKKYQGQELIDMIQSYKEKLDVQTDEIFDYILASNYEKEIGRALTDWGELGTGCWKYEEQNSEKVPFRHQYVPLNELLFNEDLQHRPNIVFRYNFKYSLWDIRSLYKKADLSCYDGINENEEVTVIECVMPVAETDTFEWILFDERMDNVLYRKIYNYNPYTIFRFTVMPNNVWGRGLGVTCLDYYERLCYCENLRARQSIRIVEPPFLLVGDKRLIDGFDLEPNGLNWGGDGIIGQANAIPMNTTGTLLPLDQDIQRYTQVIQAIHFNNPMGSVENRTTRGNAEMGYRMQLFNQKFSDATSNLYDEVLIPTFAKPKQILQDKNIVKKIDEDKYFQAKFVNLLTETVDMEEIQKLSTYIQTVQGFYPEVRTSTLNKDNTLNFIADTFTVPVYLRATKEQRQESEEMMMKQALQMQAVAEIGGSE